MPAFTTASIRLARQRWPSAISDGLHGKGIATRLLGRLADIARHGGIRAFDAFVLADNRAMLDVFADSGFEVQQTLARGSRPRDALSGTH